VSSLRQGLADTERPGQAVRKIRLKDWTHALLLPAKEAEAGPGQGIEPLLDQGLQEPCKGPPLAKMPGKGRKGLKFTML